MIVIFDLDGTLIDSAPDIHATANTVLAGEGLGDLDLPTVRSFIGRGVPHLVGRLLGAHGIEDAPRQARMVAEFGRHYDSAVNLTTVFPGVPQALAQLRAQGHVLGICTNKPVLPARAILRHVGLLDHFAVLIGGDSCPERKPHPAPLLLARSACGEGPAVYVGDSEVDAECAAAAGLPLVLYTHGYRHAPAETLPHAALLDDFARLPEVLDALMPAN